MAQRRENINDRRAFGAKKVDKRFVFVNMLKYLKPYIPILALIFFANIAGTLLSLVGPKICGLAIDAIHFDGGTDFVKIRNYALILVGVYAFSAVLEYLSAIGMAYVSRGTVKKMRFDLFAHLTKLPVGFSIPVRQAT